MKISPRISSWIILIACLTFLTLNFNSKKPDGVIGSDSEGYYLYLPAIFIHGFEDYPVKMQGRYAPLEGSDKVFTFYTYGVAAMQFPFFCVIHALAPIFGYEQDGYSTIYAYGIIFSTLFYILFGLWLLFGYLKNYLEEKTAFITVLFTLFGTNLYYYTIGEPGMSHAYSFSLFSIFLVCVSKLYESERLRYFIGVGIIFGLIFLIRPTNGLLLLLLLFYGITSFADVQGRFKFVQKHFGKFVLTAFLGFLVLVPQFLYWKFVSGHFLFYSYEEQTFTNWHQPRIGKVWFSLQNGLFIYSPLVILSVLGATILAFKNKWNGRLILLLFLLATYTFASWWAWWFGGAFGARCFVEFYALLTLPLGYVFLLIGQQLKTKRWRVFLLSGIIALLVFYSVKLTYQYDPPWDGPKWGWERFSEELQDLIRF